MSLQVVIFAKPGRLRDSLQALLNSSQKIAVAGMADCSPSLFDLIDRGQPTVLILDANLTFDRVLETLHEVRRRYAHIPCLVLAETNEQRALALEAGASHVLIKGFSLPQLWFTIHQAVGSAAHLEPEK